MSRRIERIKMVVPVKVTAAGLDRARTLLAHTLDANRRGVRLGGIHDILVPRQIVTIQYQHRKANFRVVWVGKPGTETATQAGLECIDVQKDIWGVDLPDLPAQIEMVRKAATAGSVVQRAS